MHCIRSLQEVRASPGRKRLRLLIPVEVTVGIGPTTGVGPVTVNGMLVDTDVEVEAVAEVDTPTSPTRSTDEDSNAEAMLAGMLALQLASMTIEQCFSGLLPL